MQPQPLLQHQTKTSSTHQKYTVLVRIRPKLNSSQQTVFIPHKQQYIKQFRSKSIITYSFDNVFDQTHDNMHIYSQSIQGKVRLFLQKKINTTILAYGQTGSGKTHTLFGHKGQQSQKGLTQHIITQIMQHCQLKKLHPTCTFFQIYKEKVTDLLNGNQIILRNNKNDQLILDGNQSKCVKSEQQLLDLMKLAQKNKIFGSSYVHSESSRSHVIFSIEVNGATLNVVDLCGSQVLTYKFDEKQRQQTNSINLSLFTLNAVISDLCQLQKNEKKFIPFRNSVLTRLLKKSLIDNKKTQICLFCNVSPEKQHQQFSASTLRFGQLAIEIDQPQQSNQPLVNLSQQKRELKKVSNIIEVDCTSLPNPHYYHLPSPWKISNCKIFNKIVQIYKIQRFQDKQEAKPDINILALHAYGYGCDGTDWNNYLAALCRNQSLSNRINLYSVDFPGFGKSQGQKFTSRAQKFHQKGQPLQFLTQLFKELKFGKNNQVFLIGYDLGGAIALRSSMDAKLSKCVSGVITLHPTWTDKVEKMSIIEIPTLLLWFPVQTFHLISAGQKMSKVIKNSLLYKFNIGHYTEEKTAGYYDRYHQVICQKIAQFIIQNSQQISKKEQNTNTINTRGKITEQIIQINVSKEQQQLQKTRQSVAQFYSLISNKQQAQVFQSLIKGGQNKPKFINLVSALPIISPQSISWKLLQQTSCFPIIPKTLLPSIDLLPFLTPGRQIHVCTKINLSVLKGPQQYLAYDEKNGQTGITHKAYIAKEKLDEQQILQTGKVSVVIDSVDKDSKLKPLEISVDLETVLQLNSGTRFKKNQLGQFVFQDNVTCKYDSLIMRLMMLKCCYYIREIVGQMRFPSVDNSANYLDEGNGKKLLQLQKQAAAVISEQLDLRHLVHQGIDNTRFTGTDVGRLAYYGQGNCHHLASVLAALLLPFGKILGWQVIFRAGSFFLTGRQLDQEGNPLKGWNGKPNVNVEDHTWIQVVYKPSNEIVVFDPSFKLVNIDLDDIYSLQGKMHISGKKLNFAYGYSGIRERLC